MLVPALTLPVRGATEHVATMPVPASPSGGHSAMPGRSPPVGSSSAAPSGVSSPARPAGDEHLGKEVGHGHAGRALRRRAGRTARASGVVVVGGRVDREHPRGVADAEHLAPGEPPVHVAGERRDEAARAARAAPRRGPPGTGARPTSAAGCSPRTAPRAPPAAGPVLVLRQVRNGTSSSPRLVEGEVAVHHRRDADRAEGLGLHPVAVRARRRPDRRTRPERRTRRRRASRSRSGPRSGSPTS